MYFNSLRQKPYLFSHRFTLLTRRLSSYSSSTTASNNTNKSKPQYRPLSSLDAPKKEHTDLPFDFRYSYTESNQNVGPIGLRDPNYSSFGPGRLQRELTGFCTPAGDPKVKSAEVGAEDPNLEEKGRDTRERIQGEPLTEAERKALVEKCQQNQTMTQINLGSDGLTHNMLNDIHNHWKHAEAVRIKCLGVPTVDMKNVCTQLEDKSFGKIILRHGGTLILYRGRNYDPEKRPVIPLMLWRPHEPEYPELIKTTIEGLSIEETKEMRKRGLAAPVLTKLAKNGYYGSLVPMVRDAFLVSELVRIDCQGLERSDYEKIGCKLRDLVPCILVTFGKEQIVVWRGKDYNPPGNDGQSFTHRELFDAPNNGSVCDVEKNVSTDESDNQAIRPPLLHHYEDVLRQDLLLKLNYTNVMEVPGLCEIRVVPKAPNDFMIKSGKLAMEISCGQKFKETQSSSAGKSFRSNPFLGSFKDKGSVSDITRQCTLRGHVMSNFLVRISTVMSLLDSPVEIRGNSIQFSMETEFCQFSPELEDHFEIFEHIRGFSVTIVTSANTQDETALLWSGILQKDEGETQ